MNAKFSLQFNQLFEFQLTFDFQETINHRILECWSYLDSTVIAEF